MAIYVVTFRYSQPIKKNTITYCKHIANILQFAICFDIINTSTREDNVSTYRQLDNLQKEYFNETAFIYRKIIDLLGAFCHSDADKKARDLEIEKLDAEDAYLNSQIEDIRKQKSSL